MIDWYINWLNRWLTDIFTNWLQEIGSCDYGSWEVPRFAICKLETQESQWCNSVQVQRPGDQENRWFKSHSEDRRKWMFQVKSQAKEERGKERGRKKKEIERKREAGRERGREGRMDGRGKRKNIFPSSAFLFYSDPLWTGWCPPSLKRTTHLIQFIHSNVNLFQQQPQRHTQKVFNQVAGKPSQTDPWHWLP